MHKLAATGAGGRSYDLVKGLLTSIFRDSWLLGLQPEWPESGRIRIMDSHRRTK